MKKKIEIGPRLQEFLKRKKVLAKFKRNCLAYANVPRRIQLFGGGFIFENTPEGHEFWMALGMEYYNSSEYDTN